jgi:hypothetical protein
VLPLMLYSLALWPHFKPTHDLIHDGWLHAVYFTLFLYGSWIGVDEGFWAEATRLRWVSLTVALLLLALGLVIRGFQLGLGAAAPQVYRLLSDLYMWSTILAILGWAHLKLNRPWPWLHWANESVYPWYILHQTAIIVLVFWLAPLRLGPLVEPVLLVAGALLACWGVTSVVRRVDWLRPLFGLKRRLAAAAPCRFRKPPPRRPPAGNTTTW